MNRVTPLHRPEEPLIQICDLTKDYENGVGLIPVLHRVDLSIYPGEMVAIMGPSGSGKSTLLAILGLFLAPSTGTYKVLDEDVLTLSRAAQARFRRNCVGFVFQSCNLIEHSTVYENLEYPLIYSGLRRRERMGRIQDALARVNMTHRLHHPSNLLSGGEQQRVAVARAVVNHPKVILADEPTGQLDRNNGQMVMDYFNHFVEDRETAIVLVTHDPEVAARCHRICYLEDGVLVSQGHRGISGSRPSLSCPSGES
jgi:putative ABC transport system ATP-binding protein